jgi:hypothetical protein
MAFLEHINSAKEVGTFTGVSLQAAQHQQLQQPQQPENSFVDWAKAQGHGQTVTSVGSWVAKVDAKKIDTAQTPSAQK